MLLAVSARFVQRRKGEKKVRAAGFCVRGRAFAFLVNRATAAAAANVRARPRLCVHVRWKAHAHAVRGVRIHRAVFRAPCFGRRLLGTTFTTATLGRDETRRRAERIIFRAERRTVGAAPSNKWIARAIRRFVA